MRPEVPDSASPGLDPEGAGGLLAPRPREPIRSQSLPPRGPRGRRGTRVRRHPARLVLAWAGLVVGLAGLIASAVGLTVQVLPRTFSAAQRQRIVTWEMARRWRGWPAGEIFPAAVPYRLAGPVLRASDGLTLTAHRVGIAPGDGCRAATDPGLARVLARDGCRSVLRATYVDATGALAVTVGVAVLPGPAAARASARPLPVSGGLRPGLRALPFRRTVVARFGDAQRQLTWELPTGPYLVLTTVGYADGRRRMQEATDPYSRDEMYSVAYGIGHWVASHLGASPPAPSCPGGPAC